MAITSRNSSTASGSSTGFQTLDRGLTLAVFALFGIGLVQVYSSSYVFATDTYGNGLYFFKKQILFVITSSAVLIGLASVPWRWIEQSGWVLWFLAAMGLIATLVPGIGHRAGGAARWIQLPMGLRLEPSELLKVALPLMVATAFSSSRSELFERYKWPIRIFGIGVPLVVLLLQPDFGSFFICAATLGIFLFLFGLPWIYLIAGGVTAVPLFYYLVMTVPYRRARVLAFLDPWADPAKGGFQVIQSLLSFHNGSFFGAGLGQGQGKLYFLPEAHTDFTLSVLAEETGFLGLLIVLGLFLYLIVRGLQIGARAIPHFPKMVALGLVVIFGLQVLINTGVVMGLLPTKGLTMPFLSYGGSSLMSVAIIFGVLLNIERSFPGQKSRQL